MTLRGKLHLAGGKPEQARALAIKFSRAAARTHEHAAELQPLLAIGENRCAITSVEVAIRTWEPVVHGLHRMAG